ncbi:glycosyltransferase family 2 protein [Patescibacteria group bacterium]
MNMGIDKPKLNNQLKLSVVIPVYNEKEVLPVIFTRVRSVLNLLNLDYEVIFVNDGSNDDSSEILKNFYSTDNRFKMISFSRNFGHQIAVSAGLNFVKGDIVVVMDADLQDPPEVIPDLIEKWKQDYQVVYAIRKRRKENILKKIAYRVYYQLLHRLADINIPLDTGDFCLMDCKVVNLINSLPERTRFIRGLRSWVGFKQIGVEYERDKRFAGKPKYTIRKLFSLALDGLISFSEAPLKIVIVMGFIISGLSLIYTIYAVLSRIFVDVSKQIPGWATIVVAVMFLGGVQLIIIGLIGEYITRIFNEVKCRPLYILNEKIGFDDKNDY